MTLFRSQIRLHKFRLDEVQRQVADLDRLANRLEADLAALDDEAVREQEAARRNPDPRVTYGAFAARLVDRRRKLERSIDEVEAELAQARETLREAFAELKKYELAAAAASQRALRKRETRNQGALDELSITMFRRGRIA